MISLKKTFEYGKSKSNSLLAVYKQLLSDHALKISHGLVDFSDLKKVVYFVFLETIR